jgi:ketosteroid isomerase-like protein
MTRCILGFALLGGLISTDLYVQILSDVQRETIIAEIQAIQDERNQAFVEGNCERVVEVFDESVTFYTRGRLVPSLQAVLNFCRQVERPFSETPVRRTRINALSENAAYIIQNFEFSSDSADGESVMMHEVITSIWSKGDAGWKIVHFHVSIDPIADQPKRTR